MGQPSNVTPIAVPVRPRLDSVDWLRGFVMVVMALDHVRDFFGDMSFNAIDPHETTVRHFVTRWVTHFCAPTFLFLTGVGVYLTGCRGRTKAQLAWLLLSRGAWLLVLELTYIRFFWSRFDLTYQVTGFGVFWSISWAMILMSAIVFLPDWLITCFGLIMVVGHNALDGVGAAQFGESMGNLWTLIHDHGVNNGDIQVGWMKVGTAYKIIPWVGVMMTGYGFGRVLLWERGRRQRFIVRLGLGMIAAFVVLRGVNVYGDRVPRFTEPNAERLAEIARFRKDMDDKNQLYTVNPPLPPTTFAVLSFLNCEKYPPSLDYLLMTLGPALLLLAATDRPLGSLGQIIVTFGRVPLFYYLLHIAVIVPGAYLFYFVGHALGYYVPPASITEGVGLNVPLWGVYLLWLALLVMLYFPCRWYADLKRRSRSVLLTYL
jgi:uncharacterized membrane protein